jgi:hypothetical protein
MLRSSTPRHSPKVQSKLEGQQVARGAWLKSTALLDGRTGGVGDEIE